MTRPEGSAEELEMRQKLAVQLLDRSMNGQEVAEAFDVSPGSVSRWKQTYEEEGMEGLEADPHPGKEPMLDDEQLVELTTTSGTIPKPTASRPPSGHAAA